MCTWEVAMTVLYLGDFSFVKSLISRRLPIFSGGCKAERFVYGV